MPGKDYSVPTADARRYYQIPMVHIVVGKDDSQQEFAVHRDLICGRSEFFQRALSGKWIESCSKINLPEDDADTFGLYLEFLYTNVLLLRDTEDDTLQKQYLALSKLYVLCEKMVDDQSKETVLGTILALSDTEINGRFLYPNLDCIWVIYEGTMPTDAARSALVQVYTDHGDENTIKHELELEDIPTEFLQEVCCSLFANRPRAKDVTAQLEEKDRSIEKLGKKLRSTTAELGEQDRFIERIGKVLAGTTAQLEENTALLEEKDRFIEKIGNKLASTKLQLNVMEAERTRLANQLHHYQMRMCIRGPVRIG